MFVVLVLQHTVTDKHPAACRHIGTSCSLRRSTQPWQLSSTRLWAASKPDRKRMLRWDLLTIKMICHGLRSMHTAPLHCTAVLSSARLWAASKPDKRWMLRSAMLLFPRDLPVTTMHCHRGIMLLTYAGPVLTLSKSH